MQNLAQLHVTWFLNLREASPMALERLTPNLPIMSRIMGKPSGQIKPVRGDAISFLSNVIRLHLNINCKYTVG